MFPTIADDLPPGASEALLALRKPEEDWYTRSVSRKSYVYLCGPIIGLTFDDCARYYQNVAALLPPWVVPISPMRGKPYLKNHGTILDAYPEYGPLGTQKGIVGRDFFDVRRADIVLANFLGATRPSIGSMFEIAWAFQLRKPVVVAMEATGNPHDHAFVREACDFRVQTIEQACRTIVQVVTPGL